MRDEARIERRFVKYAKALNVRENKFKSENYDGLPDRIIFLIGGYTYFIEFKAPGETFKPHQLREANLLRALGFNVYLCDQPGQAERILDRELAARLPACGS